LPKKPFGSKKPGFERVQVTFHGKQTGRRHGPVILGRDTAERVEQMVQRAKELSPNFPNTEARIVRTSGSTTVGFSHISNADWDRIFKNKKGKKK